MDITVIKRKENLARLKHAETWLETISCENVARMNDLRNGKPHTRKYDNTGRNVETTDRSVGYILAPGTKDGRDEQHAIWHLVRCLAVFGHGRVPVTETSHSLREALDAEIAYCREIGLPHRPIADYKRALDDFMDVAYYVQTPYLNDADFAAALEAKAQVLVDARYALSVAADEKPQPVEAVVVGFSDVAKGVIHSEGDRVIRVMRSEDKKPFDKRSPQERRLIDCAAVHYVRRRHVDGVDIPMSDCLHYVWNHHKGKGIFRNYTAYSNAVRYDLAHFYDMDTLVARAKLECENGSI